MRTQMWIHNYISLRCMKAEFTYILHSVKVHTWAVHTTKFGSSKLLIFFGPSQWMAQILGYGCHHFHGAIQVRPLFRMYLVR